MTKTKLLVYIHLIIFTLSSCNTVINSNQTENLDTLSTTMSADKMQATYVLSDSTVVWVRKYDNSWLNDFINGTVVTKHTKQPMKFETYSNDSLMFSISEKNHGVYSSFGNCIYLTKSSENDSTFFQDIIVFSPPFLDSNIVSVECGKNGVMLIENFKMKNISATLQLKKEECQSYNVILKSYYHSANNAFEFKRKIN